MTEQAIIEIARFGSLAAIVWAFAWGLTREHVWCRKQNIAVAEATAKAAAHGCKCETPQKEAA